MRNIITLLLLTVASCRQYPAEFNDLDSHLIIFWQHLSTSQMEIAIQADFIGNIELTFVSPDHSTPDEFYNLSLSNDDTSQIEYLERDVSADNSSMWIKFIKNTSSIASHSHDQLISFSYRSPQSLNNISSSKKMIKEFYHGHFRKLAEIKYKNIVFFNNSYTFNDNFTFYWNFNDDETIDLQFSTTFLGWIGLGWGKGMNGGIDMLCIELKSDDTPYVTDLWSESEDTPPSDSDLGGTQDYKLVEYALSDGGLYVKLNRDLKTGDKYDTVIAEGDQYIASAWSISRLTMADHGSKGRLNNHFSFTNTTGEIGNGSGNDSGNNSDDVVPSLHEYFMFIIWGFFADFGIIATRYFRHLTIGKYLHSVIFWFVYIVTIVFTLLELFTELKDGPISKKGINGAHFIIGCIILGWVTLQQIFGVILFNVQKASSFFIPSKLLKNMAFCHRVSGITLYLLAKVEIGLGVRRAWHPLVIILYFSYLVIALIVFEIGFKYYIRHIKKKDKVKNPSSDSRNQAILSSFNSHLSGQHINKEYPKEIITIFNEGIYNVTNYMHPGGNFMLQGTRGREIGRYLYGVLPFEPLGKNRHNHNKSAFRALQMCYIGQLQPPQQWNIFNNTFKSGKWSLDSMQKISKTTNLYYFANEKYKVKNKMQGHSWIGRHFTVYFPGNKSKRRQYTNVLCMTRENVIFKSTLVAAANGLLENHNFKPQVSNSIPEYSDCLPLVIKTYNGKTAISEKLSMMMKGDAIKIRGPLGTGMELERMSGSYAIIAAGTGILPFLDFFDYLYKMALQLIRPELKLLMPDDDADDHQAHPNVNSGLMENKKFKFYLYCAFSSIEDFIGYEWVAQLHRLSTEFNLGLFEAFVRIPHDDMSKISNLKKIPGRFDEKVFKEILPEEKINKFYICGPPPMMQSVPEVLHNIGVDKESLILYQDYI